MSKLLKIAAFCVATLVSGGISAGMPSGAVANASPAASVAKPSAPAASRDFAVRNTCGRWCGHA